MNQNVDDMVAEYLIFSKIPVDCKGQAWNRTVESVVDSPPGVRRSEKNSHHRTGLQIGNMQAPVIEDIGPIVQMPCGIKGIQIDQDNRQKQ